MALADRDKDGKISKSDFEKTMAEALLDKQPTNNFYNSI
jgi:Ca2+-binding EF-hand superfamily protein